MVGTITGKDYKGLKNAGKDPKPNRTLTLTLTGSFLSFPMNVHKNVTVRVIINDVKSHWLESKVGVKQGDTFQLCFLIFSF